MALIGALLACAPAPPPTLAVRRVPGGLDVEASAPIAEVTVTTADGPVHVRRSPATRLFVPVTPRPGERVRAEAAGAVATLDVPPLPADLLLELPPGAPPVLLADGDVITRVGDPGRGAVLRVVSAGEGWLEVDGSRVALGAPGTATALTLPGTVTGLAVRGPDGAVAVSWSLVSAPPPTIAAIGFPVDAEGRADPARAEGVVALPPVGWGGRDAPWAHAAVELVNPADAARTVAVRLSIDAPALAARVPGRPGEDAAAVLTLPPGGRARAVLPVWVDPGGAVPGPVVAEVLVTDAGGRAPLARAAATWEVRRPDGAAVAFAASLPVSLAGLGLLARRGPGFLRDTDVATLSLVACLAAVTFVVGAASQLVGFGIAAALGPFAPFLTALFDDLFRVALLAALVTRAPRPGVAAAAATVGFLLRGLALGGWHPADLLYLGNQVVLLESGLWLAGLTRSAAWVRDPLPWRSLRLALGFAPAQAIGVALGLVASQALYRLYWAPAYAAALVALPGFAYVVLGAVLSAPLATELDRIGE